jgi:hypoxanthine phosphoribosyltransferase
MSNSTLHAPKVLISSQEIQARLDAMAKEINALYQGTDPVIVICVLKGAFFFTADLTKRLDFPCQIEFLRLGSYGNNYESSGAVTMVDTIGKVLPDLTDRDVLILEDIIDTGLTADFFMRELRNIYKPKSLRLAVLLNKEAMRTCEVPVDFCGFVIPNHFVVGYGLDNQGLQRNLPYIGYIDVPESH